MSHPHYDTNSLMYKCNVIKILMVVYKKIYGLPIRRTKSSTDNPMTLNIDTALGTGTSGAGRLLLASLAREITPSRLPVSTSYQFVRPLA